MSDIERIAAVTGLGADELAFLDALDANGVKALADRLEAVGPERDREVDVGIEGALKMIPRLLRAPVRKILFAGTR
jgi:hypothetical protein